MSPPQYAWQHLVRSRPAERVFSRERDELWAPTSAVLAGNGGGPGFGPITANCVAHLAFSDITFWSPCMRRFHAYMHHDDHPHTHMPSCPSIESYHCLTRENRNTIDNCREYFCSSTLSDSNAHHHICHYKISLNFKICIIDGHKS